MSRPELIVVGGANGSGKTTVALKYAASHRCPYIGADAIAEELSPSEPERAAIAAGKEVLHRVAEALRAKATVVIESTLAGRSLRHVMQDAREQGFAITIPYVFLDSADACVQRVSERVRKGGHNVPEDDIRRRFVRSLGNFWHFYRPLADSWILMYNSTDELVDVAVGSRKNIRVLEDKFFALFRGLVEVAGNG